VLGFRTPHSQLLPFSKTERPVELYSLFTNPKHTGAGRALAEKMLQTVESKYTEVILFSSEEISKDSWGFYDKVGFERAGVLLIGNSSGQVFRKTL
jgi:hypothetical protein